MGQRGELLGWVMRESGTTQIELARMSGVRQPSISQFLSGRIALSDEQLDRLLGAMGYRLQVRRDAVPAELTRSERRSWALHRQLSAGLTEESLKEWLPKVHRNVERLRRGTRGNVHRDNLQRWVDLVDSGDVNGLHRALTGLDRGSIEMREISPFGGLLSEEERLEVLDDLGRAG